jgi:hypothetical protein
MELYLAEAQYILVGKLSVKLVKTIIFWLEEEVMPDCPKFPTSGRKLCNSSCKRLIFRPGNGVPKR